MYNQNYCEKAIPLVAVNQHSGKYQMTEEAIKFMRSVPAPLGVVSVAGLYRTGKSYLLNRMLLNTNKPKQGFGVGPTINPCTKGLWCWGTPIKGKSHNGESINIIVIDTEGIGALDEDQTHDTRIFTLAILASSCFIYNSVGSIDETAVQNLSLVVNLTKHIQLKSTNKTYDDQQNADEMAHYFPTFYWVVRDFSLQLQDPQGNSITSKEYLEKALAPLKVSNQFDEDIEEKNKIRKLLTSFFKDRDCFTMVRPLVDQTKLQDLDGIPFEELRPDFIEQVIQFRKRVTQGLKIKTLNGKQLNGDMYCNMMSSYVTAINEGAVPNIENAWNYMCQEQCLKIQDDCEAIFDKEIRDCIKFPVEEEYFETTCENAFEMCMMNYREKAIGDMTLSLKFEKELKDRIKEKIKNARQENIKASKEYLQKKVIEVFNPIIEQLKKQHFKTFEEFEKAINTSYQNLVQSSPNLPFTKIKYLELYKKVQRQGADYIFKCLNKEIQNLKTIFKEKEDYYMNQLQGLKNDQENDRRNYSLKISDIDKEKFENQSKIERLQIELDRLIKEKQFETEKLSKNFTFKQSEFESFRKNLENKMKETEEKFEEISKNFAKEQKVWEKDRTVMESKIKQQTSTIQELEKQKQILTIKFEELNNESSMIQKQALNKNEKKVGELENELKKLKEAKFELTENLKSAKEELQERNEKFEKTEKKLKEELNFKKREVENLKNELEMEKKKLEQELEDEKEKISKTKSTLTEDSKKQRQMITQLTEELRKSKAEFETRQAELEQKLKFMDDEKMFLKDQIEENKRIYSRQIEDLKIQSHHAIEQRQNIRIEEVTTKYTTEIKNITIEFENDRKMLTYELETLKTQKKDMNLDLKVTKEKLEQERNAFKQRQFELESKISSFEQQIKNMQRSRESILNEREKLLKDKIAVLESQIQYIKDKNDTEQRETEQKNREFIIQLRVTYERQRQDMENNYAREKERAQRKYDEMVEEYETKHRQEIENLQEEHNIFKEDALIIEENLRAENSDLKYLVDTKDKEIENLKNLLHELKLLLAKKEEEFSRKYDHLTINFKQEKEQLTTKFETLQQEMNQLEKDLMNINHDKQRLGNDLQKAKNLLKDTQDEYTTKREEYLNSIEQFKKRLGERENELMELKINYEKKTALQSQEIEHISDKNAQLQIELNRINETYEDKIKKIKTQSEQTINSMTEKYSTERNMIQEKYEKNKKAFKETQSILNKKLSEMDKQRAVDIEKISNLEMKLASLEDRRRIEISNLTSELDKMKETYKNETNNLSNQVNRLRSELEQISRKKLEIETRYEKEVLLLRNEVQNEINKRTSKEASQNQIINQLQIEIQTLQQSKTSEFSKFESSQNEQRIRIEQTYRTKLDDTLKIVEIRTRELDELRRSYENDTKDLRESLAIERQARESLQIKLDKKLGEWQEFQRRYISEIDVLKSEREQKGLEFQKELEKQKHLLKLKIQDLENKHKTTDKQRMAIFMEFEKERARSTQQQTSMNQEIDHLKDKIAKLEKDKVRLDKDNERLKVEKRNAKAASYITTRSGLEERKSTITIKKIEKKENLEYKQEDDENKENIISQQMLID